MGILKKTLVVGDCRFFPGIPVIVCIDYGDVHKDVYRCHYAHFYVGMGASYFIFGIDIPSDAIEFVTMHLKQAAEVILREGKHPLPLMLDISGAERVSAVALLSSFYANLDERDLSDPDNDGQGNDEYAKMREAHKRYFDHLESMNFGHAVRHLCAIYVVAIEQAMENNLHIIASVSGMVHCALLRHSPIAKFLQQSPHFMRLVSYDLN